MKILGMCSVLVQIDDTKICARDVNAASNSLIKDACQVMRMIIIMMMMMMMMMMLMMMIIRMMIVMTMTIC